MKQYPLKYLLSRSLMVSLLLIGLWRCSNEENMGSENTSNKNITFKGNLTGESTGKDSKLTQVGFGQLPKINDPDYLSINRFEGPIGNSIKRVAKKKETLSPLGTRLPTQRKKLVFSGEGFEIGDFERHYDQNLVIDYHYHINFDNHRIVPREPVPTLDLEEENIRSRRSLIFHQSNTLMNESEVLESETKSTPKNRIREKKRLPSVIPETKVLIEQDPDYLLKLRASHNEIDLMASKEGWNRKRFYGTD